MNLIEIDKIFPNLIEGANTDELRNGDNEPICFDCITNCCGCADCGEHEYTFRLDKDTELVLNWNNWRGYSNSIEIQCMNPEKGYKETIFYMENSLDVTSTKGFWLSEEDRKFIAHFMIRAILYLKKIKTENDNNQMSLEDCI